MTAAALIARAARQGVTITARDGSLRLSGPAQVVHDLTPEIRRLKPEILALLRPANDATRLRYATPAQLADDRVTCASCLELSGVACLAAKRGELRNTARWMEPIPDLPRRCLGYRPGPDDPDPRPGPERWPGMAGKAAKEDLS